MTEPNAVFYVPAEVPQSWTLYDVLLWVACRRLPERYWDEDGVEIRDSYNVLLDNFSNIGDYAVEYLTEMDTTQLGISKDPEILNQNRELVGEEYLLEPEFYDIKFTIENEEENEKYIQDQTRLKRDAIVHHAYIENWQQDLEEQLDVHKSQIFIKLCSGELACVGIEVDNCDDNEQIYDFLCRNVTDIDIYNSAFRTLSSKGLMLNAINWRASSISVREKLYLGVKFDYVDVLKAFPAEQKSKRSAFAIGQNLVTFESDLSAAPSIDAKRKLGRPPKDWDVINIKITEIVAEEGGLPRKQDALAHLLMEYYFEETSHKIGISTIKARLKHYYQSQSLKKSRK